jgi:hypothetical protein
MLSFKEQAFSKEENKDGKDSVDKERMFRRFLLVEAGDSAIRGVVDNETLSESQKQ